MRLEVKPHVLGLEGDLRHRHVIKEGAVDLQHLVWCSTLETKIKPCQQNFIFYYTDQPFWKS